MTETAAVSYKIQPSPDYPHVFWIELHNDGVMHECAVLKRDATGSLLFFQINHLDEIDKKRLAGLLLDRNAKTSELWDVAASRTLNNGVNALLYFHQLAKALAPNGKILDLKSGQVGTTGSVALK